MKKYLWLVIIVAIFVTLALARSFAGIYLDYLWFDILGYQNIYITLMTNSIIIQLIAFVVFFSFLFINLIWARKAIINMSNLQLRHILMNTPMGNLISSRKLTIAFTLVSLGLAFMFTGYAGNYWFTIRQFFNAQTFGINDPLFGRDIAFYVFSLPFYTFLNQFFTGAIVISILAVGLIYFFTTPPEFSLKNFAFLYEGKGHLSILVVLFFITRAINYRLSVFAQVYSTRGAVVGASYTDIFAQIPAFNILMVLSLVFALLLLINIKLQKRKLVLYSVGGLLLASIVVSGIYPGIVQKFRVEPNEFIREEEYIKQNIEYTRKAFGLDKIAFEAFPLEDGLTANVLQNNDNTIKNVRLWDYRPLEQTFNQMQGIRLYYDFLEVDTDRYVIDGELRQVMIGARELNQGKLPEESRTWINQHLQFTHGFGVAMSPVNAVTSEGLPTYFIRDIPPRIEGDISLDNPRIYFGELTNDYVIVMAETEEFDYSAGGDTNVYNTYEGDGGIPLGGFFRRALVAIKTGDFQVLFSGGLKPESRVMYDRNIFERTEKIAPFLEFDNDPYVVIYDDQLFWIRDAYSTTSRYPYSQLYGGRNYIRNSVKVVVDAYNGNVDYYISEPDDPIIQTYAQVFPGLFKSLEEMPEGLRNHIRYPEGLFTLQTNVLNTYHMQNPRIFYNREDQWEFPTEQYAATSQTMEPYYTVIQLPGEEEEEFVLMLPFTPVQRNNMIAWLAARMDGDNYGELILYNFPQERTVWGPQQIESRIDQNSLISQQLSLWDQRGSNVIRGNLLVLPIENSILYVEPLFLQAQDSEIPELARVIVAYEDMVIMEETLEEALEVIFGTADRPLDPEHLEDEMPIPDDLEDELDIPTDPADPEDPADVPPEDRPPLTDQEFRQVFEEASRVFEEAQRELQEGNWAEYGRLMEELESILSR